MKVYYCDTDSIITDWEAKEERLFDEGEGMLQWSSENKDENVPIKEAYFIQKKIYCYHEANDAEKPYKIKIKGFGRTAFDFETLKRAALTRDFSKLVSVEQRFVKFGSHNLRNLPYCTWYKMEKRIKPQKMTNERQRTL